MVKGLDHFRKHFASYSGKYALIGGTACSLLMEEVGLDFRATKDLDIVLYVEALDAPFVSAFWEFVQLGGYQNRQRSSGREIFYRFFAPSNPDFPAMLELFSRTPSTMTLKGGGHLTPMPVEDAVTSLSAILLDQEYYDFIQQGTQEVDGLPVVQATHLIPLKARAWIDLVSRKKSGAYVDEKDIRKHKNDVVRLYPLLAQDTAIPLPASIQSDMRTFLDLVSESASDSKTSLSEALKSLSRIYQIEANIRGCLGPP